MVAFLQKTSLVRRLVIGVGAISAMLLLECIGFYFASESHLRGLNNLYETQRLNGIAREIRQIVETQIDLFKAISSQGLTAETLPVLKDTHGQAKAKIEEAMSLIRQAPETAGLIKGVENTLQEVDASSTRYLQALVAGGLKGPQAARELLMLEQLEIEARDGLSQIQITLQDRSNRVFDNVYGTRFLPLQLGLAMALLFSVVAILAGGTFIRRLRKSLVGLEKATQALAVGNLDVQAPVLLNDELGRISDAFNVMAASLKTSTVSRDYVESIFESMPDLVLVLGLDGAIQRVNHVTTTTLGYEPEDLRGRQMDFLFESSTFQFGLAERAVEIRSKDAVLKHENGSKIPVSFSSSVIRERDGRISGAVCVVKDVTEHKRAEEELKRRGEELERLVGEVNQTNASLAASNQELESFSYSVSHDLRAPLRSIDGFSLALLEDHAGSLDETGRGYLNRVRSATLRMAQLIDDILNLAKVTRSELRRETCDLTTIGRQVGQELLRVNANREIDLVIRDVPAVQADPGLMKIVLENLLSNAFKFTSKHPKARIEFGSTEREGKLLYFIRDDGAGFDMRYASKLFGVFQRMHSMEDFHGTGVGLATIRRIILRHGGDIKAESAIEQGTTFYFNIG